MIFTPEVEQKIIDGLTNKEFTWIEYTKWGMKRSMRIKMNDIRLYIDIAFTTNFRDDNRKFEMSIQTFNRRKKLSEHAYITMKNEITTELSDLLSNMLVEKWKETELQQMLDELDEQEENEKIIGEQIRKHREGVLKNIQ